MESGGSLGTGVADGCEPLVGAGNLTQVPCKSSSALTTGPPLQPHQTIFKVRISRAGTQLASYTGVNARGMVLALR